MIRHDSEKVALRYTESAMCPARPWIPHSR